MLQSQERTVATVNISQAEQQSLLPHFLKPDPRWQPGCTRNCGNPVAHCSG